MVLSASGRAAQLVAKYKPPCPVVVVSPSAQVLRQASVLYGLYPCSVPSLQDVPAAVKAGVDCALAAGLADKGQRVIIAAGAAGGGSADSFPSVSVDCIGGGSPGAGRWRWRRECTRGSCWCGCPWARAAGA